MTASTFATLNDMFGNRTVCGIGRGDSAMRVAGRRPNTLARPGEAIEVIRDEIVDRFCLLGPAEAHVDKLRRLKDLGVDQFAVYAMHDHREGTIDAYGSEIIPALR